jgi:hypothetical protein
MKLIKKDLGPVKETTRERNGVLQNIRLFTKNQRQIIMDEVNNRPDGVTIDDVLALYDINPPVYYSWARNKETHEEQKSSNIPNPLLEADIPRSFSSANHLREFYLKNSKVLNEFIEKKYKEWEEKDTIAQIASKINDDNIKEVAKAGGISVNELKSFLNRDNKDLSFFTVEQILTYLKIK